MGNLWVNPRDKKNKDQPYWSHLTGVSDQQQIAITWSFFNFFLELLVLSTDNGPGGLEVIVDSCKQAYVPSFHQDYVYIEKLKY